MNKIVIILRTVFILALPILTQCSGRWSHSYNNENNSEGYITVTSYTIEDSLSNIVPAISFLRHFKDSSSCFSSFKKIIHQKDTTNYVFFKKPNLTDSIFISLDNSHRIFGYHGNEFNLSGNCKSYELPFDTLKLFCKTIQGLIPFYEYESNAYCNNVLMLRFYTMPLSEIEKYPIKNENGNIEMLLDPYINFFFKNGELIGIGCGG